jgi:chromosomal replication initiation ATPase DnaA
MTAAVRPRQLVLALTHAESFAREDFVQGPSNAAGLALVESWPDWPNRIMALTGPEGSGKSHLAAIWAEISGARRLAARGLIEEAVPGALATGALVLEDLESATLNERALFHLINLAREERASVLITGRQAPAKFSVALRDLASRLRAAPSVMLQPPGDALLRLVMMKLAADRQIALDAAVADYVANRIERSFAAARAAVARLDEESMRRHRPMTRALAAELFRPASEDETMPPTSA